MVYLTYLTGGRNNYRKEYSSCVGANRLLASFISRDDSHLDTEGPWLVNTGRLQCAPGPADAEEAGLLPSGLRLVAGEVGAEPAEAAE